MRGTKQQQQRGGLVSFFSFNKGSNQPPRPTSRSEVEAPLQISSPTDFKRVGHISYRSATGLFSGLGDAPVILFFGVPVTSQPRSDVPGYDERIPSILVIMAKELIKREGLTSEGVFRVPGESMSIERGRAVLNSGQGIAALESEPGPHVVASLIKDWCRSLSPSDSILADLDKDTASRLASEGQSAEEVYNSLCAILKEPQRSLFRWIIDLLAVVCSHEDTNRMTPPALATVFSPTLRFPEATMEAFKTMADVSKVLILCIKHVISLGGLEEKERIFTDSR